MKIITYIFVVRRGLDTVDCSPRIQRIFFKEDDAVSFIKLDVDNELKRQTEEKLWPVRTKDTGPNKWSIENYLDCGLEWCEDEVWLLEKHEVIE